MTSAASIRIYARDLLVTAEIGINLAEAGVTQPLYLDIEADIPLPEADAIEATLDYRDLQSAAHEEARGERALLIETFARRVARRCLDRIAGPGSVTVEVRKPWAIAPASAGVVFRLSKS